MNQLKINSKNTPKLRFPEFKNDWDEKRLGRIANFSKGANISKEDIESDGAFEAIRYGELYTTYAETIHEVFSKTNLPKNKLIMSQSNDVIIPASGETHIDIATASCVLKDNVALGGDINIIRTDNNGTFLAYYLNNSKKKDIARLAQGVSVVHLYKDNLKQLILKIPLQGEQQKIADFLTTVDERIEKQEKKVELSKKYKKGIMQKIFSQKIRFKDENGKDFPDWEEKKLYDILNFSTAEYEKINNNLKDGYFLLDMGSVTADARLNAEKLTENGKFLLKKDEFVMPNRDIGRGDIIGRVVLIDEDNKYVLGGNMYKVVLKRNDVPKFVYFLVNNPSVNKEMRRRANGTSQLQLIRKDIEKIKVTLPKKGEQQKIAEFLTLVDGKIELEERRLAEAKKFKKFLLQNMFV